MLGRLEAASATSRRLVSDASHELRTPVDGDAHRARGGASRPEYRLDTTGDVLLGELDRLQGMIDDLLLLARGDERALARDEVDVTDIVHEVAAAARRCRCAVEVNDEPRGSTMGDGDALRRALDHLVANAARHANDDGGVGIDVDDGEVRRARRRRRGGIPAGNRTEVVAPVRAQRRGRARDDGGAGLGLAVGVRRRRRPRRAARYRRLAPRRGPGDA